jgi:hypothetical protein
MSESEEYPPLILFHSSRGRIINLFQIESLAVPSAANPKQPYGCYMTSGVFHTLDESEFDLIVTKYAEIIELVRP